MILSKPGAIELGSVALDAPGPEDIVVEIAHTGISTGTEKLFWSGRMPPFPGMGYPLIPGYEAVGEVVQAGSGALRVGDTVFVPGRAATARCGACSAARSGGWSRIRTGR